MSNILIASTSIDSPSYGPVANRLSELGHEVLVYEADKVAHGNSSLMANINSEGAFSFSYNRNLVDLSSLGAAWIRHTGLLGYNDIDKAKQLCIEREVQDLQEVIWDSIPESKWLNPPDRIRKAQIKLAQLALAGSLGFEVPHTVVSNDWDNIAEELTDDIIIKMSRGLLYEAGKTMGLYTTRLTPEKIGQLRGSTFPYPAIFQDYIPKAREWRITIVGDNIFEAAIYTSEEAKDDWRKHQFSSSVRFAQESIDDNIKEKCLIFLGRLGLRYGAFDFIEDHEGKVTFLELNPNGQFLWLEEMMNLPISKAIARELSEIAKKQQSLNQ